jgi:signal transduction histidine kinase/CheY-like chemotaxis protein
MRAARSHTFRGADEGGLEEDSEFLLKKNDPAPSANNTRLLRSSIHLGLFGSLALMAGTPLLVNGTLESSVGFYLPMSIAFWGLLALESRGYVRLAGWGLCLLLFSAICFGVLFFGGIKQQTSVVFATVIVMAALNLGGRAALSFGVLSGLAVFLLVKADQLGLTPTPLAPISHDGMLSSTLLNLGIVAFVMRRAVLELTAATNGLEAAKKRQESYAGRLRKLHHQTKERGRFARKLSDIAEGAVHGDLETWRPRTLKNIQEMFRAVAVGLYETPSGSHAHLTARVGRDDWKGEQAWGRFNDYDFAESTSPYVYSTREGNPEALRGFPANIQAILIISIPGRSHSQGALIVMLDRCTGVGNGLAKDIQTMRSIVGSSIERSTAEQKMRIAQRMETVGRLAGSIAHDFNNLLTTIMGCSQLLIDHKDRDDDSTELLHDISRAADHAALLTRQMLVLSRKQVVLASPVDINQATQEFCRMADRMVGENIDVHLQSLNSPGYVLADPSNIEQILLNLTVNARDAMSEGGTINLSLERCSASDSRVAITDLSERDSFLLLTFSDSGSGMSPHVLSHLFEPFFTTKRSGTGLGLASAREAINAIGGEIQVTSEPNAGTTFTIIVPEEPVALKERTNRKNPAYSKGKGERILLVDDNDHVRKTLSRVLKDAGFSISVAHCGLDAVRVLNKSEKNFDLILTDIVMPTISGIDFANRIREEGDMTPILFMSGFSESSQKEIGIIGDFIAKPFTSSQLITRIGLTLSNAASPHRPSASFLPHPGQASSRSRPTP